MATDTIEAFLRDLCDESITSKSELLTLAFLLGMKNAHQTVERLVRDHPRDIRQATWKFFCLWNNVDSSEHKLDKLKTAYSLMNKEGLYQRGTCIFIAICHSVSVFPSGNLSAPGALLRPPALVTLTRDVVKVCSAGNVILQMAVAGAVT